MNVPPVHPANSNGVGGRAGRLGESDRGRPVEHVDMALEGDVLTAFVTFPELIGPSGVRPGDFYSGANEVICRVLLELVERGARVDFAALQGALADARLLEQVGGANYLLSFSERMPSRAVDTRRLRILARRRVVAACARRVARASAANLPRLRAQLDAALAELDAVIAPPPALCPPVAQQALIMRPLGKRIPTGFPTLDKAFRGGVPLGSVLMCNGAPGAGKTAFAAVLGDRWEREGCAVLYYAADQHADGILVRVAQMAGFSRDAFEAEGLVGERIRVDFSRAATGRVLHVFDPYCEVRPRPLEHALAELELLAGDRPRVLIVDSLQTAPCAAAEGTETPRARVDAVIAILKRAARRGTTVIALSETNRGAYSSPSKAHRSRGLASGKESSGIEFQADALLVFGAVDGEPDLIDLEVPKNSRFGEGNPEVRFKLDRPRHALDEIEVGADGDGSDAEQERARGKVCRDAARLAKILAQHPNGLTARKVRASARAGGIKLKGVEIDAALHRLERGLDGVRAVNRGTEHACRWCLEPIDGGRDE